jgi:hypothetical protein
VKILFIGNSFSQDTTKYLESIAGGELFVRNLYIGGCSLKMHAENIQQANPAYAYEKDAECTAMVSINDALLFEKWDVIGKNTWTNPPYIVKIQSWNEHIEYIQNYLTQSLEYLEQVYPPPTE